jgi:GrpB-like predicted nucleotidyltransferase (UPF0157 family)
MSKRRIDVVPYDAKWPTMFLQERAQLLARLPIPLAGIHHIGSTAVEGLAAKPVIDLLLEVADIHSLDRCSQQFESLGYESKGEYGITGRRFYQKGGDSRTHHIHAFELGSKNALRHIAFKEYLKAHPPVAYEYGLLKRKVALSCNNDIGLYCDGKADFLSRHERLAIAWWAKV